VIGDIIRINDQLPWGLLKFGGLVEGSDTYRQKAYYDFTTDTPDNEYTPAKDPLLTAPTNCKTCEHSNWLQEQAFIDFYWKPLDGLTITPGFKYVNFRREINAAEDTLSIDTVNSKGVVTTGSTVGPIYGTNTYDSPLYFLTANYKILPEWSIYGQFATSFLIPQLSELQVPGVELQNLKPETTGNYQIGSVYSKGRITADADIYMVNAANTNVPCNIPDPQGGYDAASCNAGKVHYNGFEGEAAYALPFGLTAFANGSINNAKQLPNAANAAEGISANPAQELANVPNSTAAFGGIYAHGPWHASLSYKLVGQAVTYGLVTAAAPGGTQLKLPSYDTWNAAIDYDFGHFEIKLQGFNLLDKRTLIAYTPSGSETALYQANGGEYEFESGREVQLTLVGKF
jgi:iron complex outermembrane receptor protein